MAEMNTGNPAAEWLLQLAQRPEIFPHQLDLQANNVLLVELPVAEIGAASFLDQRVLTPTTKGTWVSWVSVADAMSGAESQNPVHYIFHVGHCGSTLLSRLVQTLDDVQSLREPLPLRTLAQDFADAADGRSFLTDGSRREYLQVLSRLWGRGEPYTVVKATSICSDLLPHIHAVQPECRSVFVYNRAETHIATLLAGENAMIDLRGFARLRLQRLQKITGLDIRLHELNSAQLAALGWLSETTSIAASGKQHGAEIELLEFDEFLKNPADTLAQLLHFMNIPAAAASIENAVHGDVLQTYSKAPEHEYNAQTRAAILASARSEHAGDIAGALRWIEELAKTSSFVAAGLDKFG